MINLERMCDRCFRPLGDNEEMHGFRLNDGRTEKVIKGHKGCVEEITEILKQLYGLQEQQGGQ